MTRFCWGHDRERKPQDGRSIRTDAHARGLELVGEPLAPLPVTGLVREAPPKVTPPASKTLRETLDALREAEDAEAVIERLHLFERPEAWGRLPIQCLRDPRTASGGTFVWDADFPGNALTLFDAQANCYAYFAGADDLGGLIPPPALTGQVWASLRRPGGRLLLLPTLRADLPGPVLQPGLLRRRRVPHRRSLLRRVSDATWAPPEPASTGEPCRNRGS